MLKKKQPNGYYYCESSIVFGKPFGIRWNEALHRETQALLSRLNQIKELLSSPEIRTKISKELFEDRHNSNSKWKNFCHRSLL
uniref:Uncharacterized protein n=1 Tax=Strix occidentalis caurina TaxID=311401 RepID=A0A8D0FLJ9_STROC